MIDMTRRHLFLLTSAMPGAQPAAPRTLSIVCVGAHPDDPESGCGGTLARYAMLGHRVTIIYLTRGEAGIPGKSAEEAAAVRTNEAISACKILGAKPVFAGQVDGATLVDRAAAASLTRLITDAAPDVVLTQWPIDTHMDHQAASVLTFRAWIASGRSFDLFYYEVDTGSQTMNFNPTHYVDITVVRERKKQALFVHKSQNGEGIYRTHHEIMENFRGREFGVSAAEAFVHLARSIKSPASLPGL